VKFWFDQNIYGTYREVKTTGNSGRFSFSCRAEADLLRFAQERSTRLTGTVSMEGVVEDAPMEGTLLIDPLQGKKLIYDFTFTKGKSRYRYLGRNTVRFLDPFTSMTTLAGNLERDGVTLADVNSRFNVLELPKSLLSFRLGF